MLDIQEYVDISAHTTMRVGGQFRYFVNLNDPKDLLELFSFAKDKGLPVHIIGGGSNMVFPDGVFNYVVAHIQFFGFEIINETEEYADLKVGAGESWDFVVESACNVALSGIEAMSAIPGTCGATPVQNVGAYGQEIKDTLISVEVYDKEDGTMKSLSNAECKFAYRDSIFKHEPPEGVKGRYIITAIVLRLSKLNPKIPNYPGVKKYFLEMNINNPTLLQIREAIIDIRKNKLPNPNIVSNAGSFFKNPMVSKELAHELKENYPNITLFPNGDAVKVPAGFLIEAAGLKGKDFGEVSIYPHNALVLVNNGKATRADIVKAKDEIIKTVYDKFGITLEPEPEFV